MPKVPQYNHKPLKSIYVPRDTSEPSSLKQRNLIITLCERRKISPPNFKLMNKGQAAEFIDRMLNKLEE